MKHDIKNLEHSAVEIKICLTILQIRIKDIKIKDDFYEIFTK